MNMADHTAGSTARSAEPTSMAMRLAKEAGATAKDALANEMRNLAADFGDLYDRARMRAAELNSPRSRERMAHKAEEVKQNVERTLSSAGANARDAAERSVQSTSSWIRANPLSALGVASALGLAGGLVTRWVGSRRVSR